MTSSRRKISFPPDSVLMAIIQDGDIAELNKILKMSSHVDLNQTSHSGLTALHHGVLGNNLDAVKLLLTHGARVDIQDTHGFSPLHTASACGFLHITSILILFGANVFSQTHQSELPIDLAKDLAIIRLLSKEMTRLVHSELYVPSLLVAKCWQLYTTLRIVVIVLVELFSRKTKETWYRYRRKQD